MLPLRGKKLTGWQGMVNDRDGANADMPTQYRAQLNLIWCTMQQQSTPVALLLWQRVVNFESRQAEVGVFKGNKQCALVAAAY